MLITNILTELKADYLVILYIKNTKQKLSFQILICIDRFTQSTPPPTCWHIVITCPKTTNPPKV
jgi:hypothetical protein